MSQKFSHQTFKGGKKKTKKKKKSLKQKQQQQKKNREAKKYIDAMNASLKQIHSDKNLTIFTKEDDLLWTSGYLKIISNLTETLQMLKCYAIRLGLDYFLIK